MITDNLRDLKQSFNILPYRIYQIIYKVKIYIAKSYKNVKNQIYFYIINLLKIIYFIFNMKHYKI